MKKGFFMCRRAKQHPEQLDVLFTERHQEASEAAKLIA
jgi:hypothetical protein